MNDLPAPKRRSSPTIPAHESGRGCPQQPHAVAGAGSHIGYSDSADPNTPQNTTIQRTLALKAEIDWKREADKKLYQRLRDLSWQAAHYRNAFIRRMWAEAMGFQIPDKDDKHSVTKQGRQSEKGDLSGAAYSAAEREVAGAWVRDGKKMLAGQPLCEWKPTAALSVRGHKNKNESGVRLEVKNDQYVVYLQAQSKESPGGCWLCVPIAKHTRRDDYQGELLDAMVSWRIPISKATVQVKQHGIIIRLSYARNISLPTMGSRVATIGPVSGTGRMLLRTELETKDYTSQLATVTEKKDSWDLIRRRIMAQIGRKHGHARIKREVLASRFTSFDAWAHSYIHEWTRHIVTWCQSQGVGMIRVESLGNGDWPAYKFVQLLKSKAEEAGITVSEGADIQEASGARAAKAAIGKRQKDVRKRREAVRELQHQMKGHA